MTDKIKGILMLLPFLIFVIGTLIVYPIYEIIINNDYLVLMVPTIVIGSVLISFLAAKGSEYL